MNAVAGALQTAATQVVDLLSPFSGFKRRQLGSVESLGNEILSVRGLHSSILVNSLIKNGFGAGCPGDY